MDDDTARRGGLLSRATRISSLLAVLVVFDVVLVVWAGLFPGWWFAVFHGAPYVDPQALLPRMAANWTAFALVQLVAWWRWRAEPEWLLVVAGVRLSDVFTDPTCVALAEGRTWFALATLPLMGVVNLLLGVVFVRAWQGVRTRR